MTDILRRLKVYIHDYLVKNSMNATAAQLNAEARLGEQPPPISAAESVLAEYADSAGEDCMPC